MFTRQHCRLYILPDFSPFENSANWHLNLENIYGKLVINTYYQTIAGERGQGGRCTTSTKIKTFCFIDSTYLDAVKLNPAPTFTSYSEAN